MNIVLDPPSMALISALSEWVVLLVVVVGFTAISVQKYVSDAQVKRDLKKSERNVEKKMSEIHRLVNSDRGVLIAAYVSACEANVSAMETIAELTNTPRARQSVSEARKVCAAAIAMLAEHNQKQMLLDAANEEQDKEKL